MTLPAADQIDKLLADRRTRLSAPASNPPADSLLARVDGLDARLDALERRVAVPESPALLRERRARLAAEEQLKQWSKA